jgi:hypothetical protein
MGYYVRTLPWKKSDPKWKLQFVSYKSQDTKESKAIKAKKEWDIDLYGGRKGFTDLMLSKGNTIENISIWMGHSTLDRT